MSQTHVKNPIVWVNRGLLGLVVTFLAIASQTAAVKRAENLESKLALIADKSDPVSCQTAASVTFHAVGDIMLSRGVERMISRSGDPTLPFSALEDEFRSVDFNFGNFESPVSGNDGIYGKGLVFNTHSRDLQGLMDNNFRIVSTANNHAMDQGRRGLTNTIDALSRRGITTTGTGEDLDEAWTPKVLEVKGIRIAFIATSYASVNDGGVARNEFVARTDDLSRLALAVAKARQMSDLVVVSMHAGIEYTRKPNQEQVTFAHAAIDAGADIVIGAHPHWVQSSEIYNGRPIYYSLGNFIFDQKQPGTTDGLMLKIEAVKETCGTEDRVHMMPVIEMPVIIERGGVPRLAQPSHDPARSNR